jgi:serpin B
MNIHNFFFALIALSLLPAACGPRPAANMAQSNERRATSPNAPADDVRALVDGDNAFALDLYRSLRPQDGNLIFSPYSVSLALAMTYAGARGGTESQMAQTLHYALPQDRLHPAFNQLDLDLANEAKAASKDEQPLQLNIANGIWAEQTYSFLQGYLDLIATNYGAGIHLADFINQFEPTRKEINGWVSDQTKNKIKDLLPEGALNTYTRMVLVNAIYFKADWEEQFDPNDTSDSPFHLLDGSQVQVEMMNAGRFDLPYTKGNGYQAVELNYSGSSAAMDILIPDEGRFSEFETSLDAAGLNGIMGEMQPASVQLGLPKFTFTNDFSLSDQLKDLGMSDAFDGDKADFSGMTGQHDLFISNVVHKAFVAVDEKGTEAAAATGVVMQTTSALMYDVNLIIDRPFIFVIRDLQTGQILFMGRVLNPAQ